MFHDAILSTLASPFITLLQATVLPQDTPQEGFDPIPDDVIFRTLGDPQGDVPQLQEGFDPFPEYLRQRTLGDPQGDVPQAQEGFDQIPEFMRGLQQLLFRKIDTKDSLADFNLSREDFTPARPVSGAWLIDTEGRAHKGVDHVSIANELFGTEHRESEEDDFFLDNLIMDGWKRIRITPGNYLGPSGDILVEVSGKTKQEATERATSTLKEVADLIGPQFEDAAIFIDVGIQGEGNFQLGIGQTVFGTEIRDRGTKLGTPDGKSLDIPPIG
jgi:hypothetical protein